MKQESSLKSALMATIKRELHNFVVFRHEDVRTNGIPDLSCTGYGKTSWWEVKHATPKFSSTGIQHLTMQRLAAAGIAYYILYYELKGNKRTLIVHPRHLTELQPDTACTGFDHQLVTDFIKTVHSHESHSQSAYRA